MNKKYKILIALLFIVIMLLGIIVIINNNNDNKVNISGGILQEGIIPGYTEEQIKEILQKKS